MAMEYIKRTTMSALHAIMSSPTQLFI